MAGDDLDRLLAETMYAAAGRAPSDDGLLRTVRSRSDRYRRQRIATVLTALAAVLAVGLPAAAVFLTRTTGTAPAGTAAPPPAAPAVRLVAGYTTPDFPYRLPATGGMGTGIARLTGGRLSALFPATEQRHHADVTVTLSDREPAFTGPATDTPVRVHGHPATLRTVDVRPARQLTLYWPESPGRWIQLATDDTYTAQQVVALGESLIPAPVPVLPPFRLDLSPAGFVTDTVTESTISFRRSAAAPADEQLKVVLRKPRPFGTPDQTVGGYPALLTHHAGGTTLDVDVTDWHATLEVTAGNGLAMTDGDLLRFAEGVHILDRSDPE